MIGGLWFSKALFANTWVKSTGIEINNHDAKKGIGGVMSGIKLGLFTGVFFSTTSISISYLYQRKPKILHLIDTGYHIVGSIAAAIILCLWQ